MQLGQTSEHLDNMLALVRQTLAVVHEDGRVTPREVGLLRRVTAEARRALVIDASFKAARGVLTAGTLTPKTCRTIRDEARDVESLLNESPTPEAA